MRKLLRTQKLTSNQLKTMAAGQKQVQINYVMF